VTRALRFLQGAGVGAAKAAARLTRIFIAPVSFTPAQAAMFPVLLATAH
jgi:hypothetical protein